ncbi:MAG TPA: multiprotein bridging factor aMBF1 [Candidatus Nanoarchaeia archaeon]|nr:multiprotein bridging factor aMBF1 [Candidatus Nanoarchaeia archaeon]
MLPRFRGCNIICEMCGSEGKMFKAEIEGSFLTVCSNCAGFGKIISEVKQQVERSDKPEPAKFKQKEQMSIVVEDFADRIRKKREALNLTQEEFAQKVNEKVSVIHHIETGKLTPNLDLAQKLGKFLGISLVEEHEEAHEGHKAHDPGSYTIGDFIKIKKR